MIDISFVRYFTIWSRNLGYCYAQPPVINVQPQHYAPNHHHHTWILQIGTLNTDSFWSISVCSQSFFSTCGLKSSAGADWRTPLTAEISTPLGSKFDFQDLPPWLHNSPMHEYCCIQGQPVSLPCTSSSFLDLLFPRASVRSLAMFSETLEYKN